VTDTHSSWDDDGEPADLDASRDGGEASDLDAFDVYTPAVAEDGDSAWDSIDPSVVDDVDGELQTLLFTITNPQRTVSVTAAFDGKIQWIELSPKVTTTTESQLAEEITVLARLARQRARAGQHALIVEFMRILGHDRVATRGFLEHDLRLPSPETVKSEVAQVFASRYAGDFE
jgi:ESX secretion-associated protein EspD/H